MSLSTTPANSSSSHTTDDLIFSRVVFIQNIVTQYLKEMFQENTDEDDDVDENAFILSRRAAVYFGAYLKNQSREFFNQACSDLEEAKDTASSSQKEDLHLQNYIEQFIARVEAEQDEPPSPNNSSTSSNSPSNPSKDWDIVPSQLFLDLFMKNRDSDPVLYDSYMGECELYRCIRNEYNPIADSTNNTTTLQMAIGTLQKAKKEATDAKDVPLRKHVEKLLEKANIRQEKNDDFKRNINTALSNSIPPEPSELELYDAPDRYARQRLLMRSSQAIIKQRQNDLRKAPNNISLKLALGSAYLDNYSADGSSCKPLIRAIKVLGKVCQLAPNNTTASSKLVFACSELCNQKLEPSALEQASRHLQTVKEPVLNKIPNNPSVIDYCLEMVEKKRKLIMSSTTSSSSGASSSSSSVTVLDSSVSASSSSSAAAFAAQAVGFLAPRQRQEGREKEVCQNQLQGEQKKEALTPH